jgi:F0F1-type ATP synthase membrane subunit c/vacuolar-type H+-ATPase subunit K
VATAITVAITDIGAGIRAGQATQAAMNNAAAAQRQQEIKKSQQQAAPTF